jgi:hypothetical protein
MVAMSIFSSGAQSGYNDVDIHQHPTTAICNNECEVVAE